MTKELTLLATGDIYVGMPDDHPHIHNVARLPAKPDLIEWFGKSKKCGATFRIEGDEIAIQG